VSASGPALRPAAVAGAFYPSDADVLARAVDSFVEAAGAPHGRATPKAIVVPHAGYRFSGPIAGHGYAAIRPLRGVVERVVLLGPAHFVHLDGLATVSVDALDTPLGPIAVDDEARRTVLALPGVTTDDAAHAREHSLEVHLPFLARVLGDVRVLPLVVGRARPEAVAEVLDAVWGGPETLLVVSSDLSHYLDHASATRRDSRTAEAIVAGHGDELGIEDACGVVGMRGFLLAASRHQLDASLLDLRNSGDTSGRHDSVVGYGAFAFTSAR
jgi:MEMO1 family protein